jgi:hypothetical protein
MDPNTRALLMGAAGAGGAEKIYIEDCFSCFLYTGTGSNQTITNGIDLAGKGGLTWIKSRSSGSWDNWLFDSSNSFGQGLSSNQTGARSNAAINSVSSTGFEVKAGFNSVNESATTYASWTFRKAPKFFDVVTYTGNGANRTIAHNLGSVPGCIIVKSTSQSDNWKVYHRSLTSNAYYILLDSTAAQSNAVDLWNSTTPTSTAFSIGSSGNINTNGATYVAYVFAHDAGGFGDTGNDSVIKCGSFTTTTSGAVVDLGWEPQFILFKRSDGTGFWEIIDSMRGASLSDSSRLFPNSSAAEATAGAAYVYPTATGFVVDGPNRPFTGTGIYIAIRRGPMKTPTDPTKVFSTVAYTGNSSNDTTIQNLTTNIAADMAWISHRNSAGQYRQSFDKLRGSGVVAYQNATFAEDNFGSTYAGASVSFDNTQTILKGRYTSWGIYNTSGDTFAAWNFRRAPGFFDVVAYTGTESPYSGGSAVVPHNLGVAPELLIVKSRTNSLYDWSIYSSGTGNAKWLSFTNFAASNDTFFWNSTTPGASSFTVGSATNVNRSSYTYIAYLFATCPGVSKVGSYTGTGTTQQINCGFTAGSRFVMIKRTDSSGDWYVWDTARGIVSGNDPYLLLNSSAAEVTGTDYIDPLSSGFEISSSAPAAINANGGSFIFLAVA